MVPKAPPAACASTGTVSVDKSTLWYLTRHMLSEYMVIKRSTPLLLFSPDVMPNLVQTEFNGKNSFWLAREHGHVSLYFGVFFPDSFGHTEEYFLYLQFQEYLVIKARNKEANHLQPQQLGFFLLFALNICTIHTDFLQTDTLFPGEYYWQNLYMKKHQSRGLRTGHMWSRTSLGKTTVKAGTRVHRMCV